MGEIQIAVPEVVVSFFGGRQGCSDAKILAEVRGSEGGKKPINHRLELNQNLVRRLLKPRSYQEKLYLTALKQNVIIYLGTGLGKTFITVLVLRSPKIDSEIQRGRKVAFLTPTQDLTKQQALYFFETTPYKIRVYCGRTCQLGIHIDNWSKETWQAELKKIDVLFMTPQIFTSAIMHNLLSWDDFSVVVFDEFHHACSKKGRASGHPYGRALEHLKGLTFREPPRIIGLTASLVNNLPKDYEDIQAGITGLERLANAICVTDAQVNDNIPLMVIHAYNKSILNKTNDVLVDILQKYAEEMDLALKSAEAKKASITAANKQTSDDKRALAFYNRLKLASKGFSIKPSSFPKILRAIAGIRIHCGMWTMGNVCCKLIGALEKHGKNSCLREDMRPLYKHFASLLKSMLLPIYDCINVDSSQMLLTYSQPKVLTLLDILKREHDDIERGTSDKSTFSCIVFVKSRIQVVAICSWLKMVSERIAQFSFIKVDYAIGLAATAHSKWACITARKSSEQTQMLENFRKRHLNVIITTSVLEEGIDLPVCSTVIRYDEADTFRVYVQSRGRARQNKSSYVAMCEQERSSETELNINKFNDFEDKVKKVLSDGGRVHACKPVVASRGDRPVVNEEDCFYLGDGKIKVDGVQAKITLHMYVQRLTKRSPFSHGLTGETNELDDGKFVTTLYLPIGSPVEQCKGFARSSIEYSEISAYVETVKKLHEKREFDDSCIPKRETLEHLDEVLRQKNLEPDLKPLSPELEGEVSNSDEKGLNSFEWKLYHINERLSSNCKDRVYKLYKIIFNAKPGDVREDIKLFFTKQTFGMVVGSDYSADSLPKKLFSHYGQFEVTYELITDQMIIDNYSTHNTYIRYTQTIIRKLLNIDFKPAEFNQRCVFYLLAIGDNNEIKLETIKTNRSIQVNDIVKLQYYYSRNQKPSFFLVKAIRHDMGPRSKKPGTRGITFHESLIRDFGSNALRDMQQPVIEVIPISTSLATTSQGKRINSSYESTSRFYLYQVFELVEYPPEMIFQASNLHEILYGVYLSALALDWARQFYLATSGRRGRVVNLRPIASAEPTQSEHENQLENIDCDHSGSELSDSDQVEQQAALSEHDDDHLTSDDENDYDSDDDSSDDGDEFAHIHSSDSDSDVEPQPKNRLVEIHSKKMMQLNDSTDRMEKWNLDLYQVKDLKRLTFEHRSSYKHQNLVESVGFTNLYSETRPHQDAIIAKLKEIQRGILSDDTFVGDEEALAREEFKVNLDLKPSLSFHGHNNKPIIDGLRLSDLIRALTQRRANSVDNLESLENIGDSYLKYVISVILFKELDHEAEGLLTHARSRLTSNKHFYHLAKKNRLGYFAITEKFNQKILQGALGGQPASRNTLRPKALADMLESFVGCCLMHGGEFEAILAIEWLGLVKFPDHIFVELHEDNVRFSRPTTALLEGDSPQVQTLYKNSKSKVKRLEQVLNYQFQDPSYLIQAVTHASSSSRCTQSYERLEFLGDAVLDYLITMTLFTSGVDTPGQLTTSRSALVNNYCFAKLVLKYRFHIFLEHASQSLHDDLVRVSDQLKDDPEMEFFNMIDFDAIIKLLGDMFESIAGAIYVDSGCSLDAVWKIYYPIMKDIIDEEIRNPTKNELAQLYETFPGANRIRFDYLDVMQFDECHVGVTLTIDDKFEYSGEGLSQKQAKLRAVRDFWRNPPSDSIIKQTNDEFNRLNSTGTKSRPGHHIHRAGGRGRESFRGGCNNSGRAGHRRGGHNNFHKF